MEPRPARLTTKFEAKQSAVDHASLLGLVIVGATLGVCYYLQPTPAPASVTAGNSARYDDRLDMCRWLLPAVGYLGYRVVVIILLRASSPELIDGSAFDGKVPEQMRIASSILQNSLEQTVIATVVNAAWIATMPLNMLCMVPGAVATFLIGRLLFANGYSKGPSGRALGMALTMASSAILFLLEIVWWVAGWK
jgi:uncharacterized membrane protein YecN with MAPEG domain